MKKVQPEEGKSADVVSENVERLKELFPEAFSEGGVNFDVLRQLLGDARVLDEGEEKYGLNWHGKKKARQIALTPSTGTLIPCPEESVDWDTTQNLFIEGDNLEVLKLLQKSYANKVKMIYIDPPYNTGKEFIYPDKFSDTLDTYLKYTGQVDNEGMKFSSNTETTGRMHTNWLNMMYPRLKLARNLLMEDGLIFINIDDNEQSHLRLLCDHIFGRENFIANYVWKARSGKDHTAKHVSVNHEHILGYAKNIQVIEIAKDMRVQKQGKYSDSKGSYSRERVRQWGTNDRRIDRPTMFYPVLGPDGNEIFPIKENGEEGCWRVSKSRMKEYLNNGEIDFVYDEKRKEWDVYAKKYEGKKTQTAYNSILDTCGTSSDGTREIKEIFVEKIFDTAKPLGLINHFLHLSHSKRGIILDFFAGSATIAHAVMQLNAKDGGQRNFICVQLPESIDEKDAAYNSGYRTIADIGKERIRRAAKKIEEEQIGQSIRTASRTLDLGFKVFKLNSSNIRHWNPDTGNLEQSLLSHENHLVEGRSEQDVLYELLLKRGVDLAVPIESRHVSGKRLYSIGHGVLFACLDESITKDQVEDVGQAIVEWHEELKPSSDTHVFFRDSAFSDDVAKTNMAAILEQNGISHVRSL